MWKVTAGIPNFKFKELYLMFLDILDLERLERSDGLTGACYLIPMKFPRFTKSGNLIHEKMTLRRPIYRENPRGIVKHVEDNLYSGTLY